ncbi:uncharacterized protein BP5553_03621 [Venustampulla echinocandica]|uniref:Heterokaryon incompatibility domain-containing protein n=1 Tax=Venustampulla echinocandica TaxID=2656787 RepID=A0A370TUS8_9HELO|nr:uncharacterized protein BP5553_03621 [Venustampulla echinocandica]RDL39281.1 hypothetical protein BP5553_03621 [Venustampulla echinocandica]
MSLGQMEPYAHFKYMPLDVSKNTTRVVTILQGNHESPIQCTITEMNLDCPPPYCALSYVWGSPSRVSKILLDQKEMAITHNLHTALKHLRSHEEDKTFWIDALCIDQLNMLERKSQVQKMREIYGRSTSVLIWLGADDDESASAFTLASTIGEYWLKQGVRIDNAESEFRNRSKEELARLLDDCNCKFDSSPVEEFRLLLARDWFQRVWILQEAAAPVNSKTIQCGNSTIDWWGFLITAAFLSHAVIRPDLKDYFNNVKPFGSVSMRGLFNLAHLQRKLNEGRYSTDLLATLASYRHFKATDPRDKVYALLGLVNQVLKQSIVPDYSLDLPSVYLKVAEYFIIQQGSIKCLGYCNPSFRDPDLPSWVPDWRNPGVSHPLAVYPEHRAEIDDLGHVIPPIYLASGEGTFRKAHMGVSVREKQLVIEGVCLGTATIVGLPNYLDASNIHMGDILRGWEPKNLQGIYEPTGETVAEAFSRTLVADVAKKGRSRKRGFKLEWNFWRSVDDFSRPPPLDRPRLEWGSLLYATAGRGCVWLDSGYLCLAPGETKPGDYMCILLGGHVAYTLRPIDGKFHLVGECYVHGFMDGQAIDLLEAGRFKSQTFVIE